MNQQVTRVAFEGVSTSPEFPVPLPEGRKKGTVAVLVITRCHLGDAGRLVRSSELITIGDQ